MLFALIFPRAQRASTFDTFAERNVWLQSALRSFAKRCETVCLETALFAIRDRLRSYGNQLKGQLYACNEMEAKPTEKLRKIQTA